MEDYQHYKENDHFRVTGFAFVAYDALNKLGIITYTSADEERAHKVYLKRMQKTPIKRDNLMRLYGIRTIAELEEKVKSEFIVIDSIKEISKEIALKRLFKHCNKNKIALREYIYKKEKELYGKAPDKQGSNEKAGSKHKKPDGDKGSKPKASK